MNDSGSVPRPPTNTARGGGRTVAAWAVATAAAGAAAALLWVLMVCMSQGMESPVEHEAGRIVAYVERAAGHYSAHGWDATTQQYAVPLGGWYLIVVDGNGTVLHDPYPAALSAAVTDTGELVPAALVAAAAGGGGWVSTRMANPLNDLLERKHMYAIEFDGLVFASGYYE